MRFFFILLKLAARLLLFLFHQSNHMERVMDQNSYAYRHHIKRYAYVSSFIENKLVCSVACGTGYGEKFMAENGKPASIKAFDVDRAALDYAQKNNSHDLIAFSHMDSFDDLVPKESVDVFLSLETVEHINEDEEFVNKIWLSLKPGGIAIISTPNKAFSYKNLWSRKPLNEYHVREYTKDSFIKLIKNRFNEIELLGQKRILKRSIRNLPVYLYYKLFKKLKNYETDDFDVKPFPNDEKHEMAYMMIICKK